jgi:hypothetical protein
LYFLPFVKEHIGNDTLDLRPDRNALQRFYHTICRHDYGDCRLDHRSDQYRHSLAALRRFFMTCYGDKDSSASQHERECA